MFQKIKNIIGHLYKIDNSQSILIEEIRSLKSQLGSLQAKELQADRQRSFSEAEFKVFSQFGDDGLIQYLVQKLKIKAKTFIEFGVETYTESNTRFLLLHDNWKGLVIDGDQKNISTIQKEELYWRHDLTAVQSFITRDNINRLFTDNGFQDEIGLLSIDIDGNDYWVWEAIQVVNPIIVIVEYNSVFGKDNAITIPYDERFTRNAAHYSNLYWGTSLKALCYLAEMKGYGFIGSNSAGNNAYFVRKDHMSLLTPVTCADGFRESRFRESKDEKGQLSFLSGDARLLPIRDCPVVEVTSGKTKTIKDIFNL